MVNILDIIDVVNLILGVNEILCDIDYDYDGTVNILDIIPIINYIASDGNLSLEQRCISDINQDDVINVLDVVMLISIILE